MNKPTLSLNCSPRLTSPLLQDRQERQVGVAQVGPPLVLEDVADGPRQAAFRVVQRSHKLPVQPQLQHQSVARQEEAVPTQRNHLETQT